MKRLKDEALSKPQATSAKDTFGNIVKIVQSLAWPVLVMLLFIFYRDPFSRTIDQIPDLISHATEMQVGSVSLKIEQKAASSSDTRLADALKGLSPDARRILLEAGESYTTIWGTIENNGTTYYAKNDVKPGFQELVQRKLVEFVGPRNPNGPRSVTPTEKDPRDLDLTPAPPGAVNFGDDHRPEIFVPKKPLTPEELVWIDQEEFRLTDLGKKAFDIIVDVVTHS